MKTLEIRNIDIASNIFIEKGIFKNAANHIYKMKRFKRVCVVADENTAKLYLSDLRNSLIEQGGIVSIHILKAGEQSKTLKSVADIMETLCENSIARGDLLIALGGGMVGDITGFVASTYLRGISIVQIPTTLLAQVDSSVGGKNGVNLPQGKNLVGTFYQPRLVLVDSDLLKTLDSRQTASGMAEVVKMGLIGDKKILTLIKNTEQNIEEILYRCIKFKKQIVEMDEKDNGIRNTLNFGHTVGHAIEKIGGFQKYTHGEAVAIGMVYALKLGENYAITKGTIRADTCALLESLNLPTSCDFEINQIINGIKFDKKKRGDTIGFVLLRDYENPIVEPISLSTLYSMLKELS